MPARRANVRRVRSTITPEVVAAYAAALEHQDLYHGCTGGEDCRSSDPGRRHCSDCRAHIEAHQQLDLLLGLKPWEVSPLDAVGEREPDGTAWAASWPRAVELREQIEAELSEERG